MNNAISKYAMGDSLQGELSGVVGEYFAQHSVSVHGCILMAMRCVEIYHERVVKVSSEGKRQAVKDLVPIVIAEAVKQHLILQDEADRLLEGFHGIMPYVDSICTAFVTISKHPTYLKFKKRVKSSCAPKKQKLSNSEN
jgi:hypothetical protein